MPDIRRILVPLIPFALWCAAADGLAQTLPPDKDPPGASAGPNKAKLEIELPAGGAAPSVPLTGADVVKAMLPDLARYPDATARDAVSRLAMSGPDVVAPLRHVLNGQDLKPRIAAAMALAELGDRDSLPGIQRLVLDPRAERFADDLFLALESLDRERAIEVAVRSARGKDAGQSAAGMRFLRARSSAELVPVLMSLLDCERARVRQQTFELLQQLEGEDLSEAALGALGDLDAGVAEVASRYLQVHRDPAVIDRLAALAAVDPPTRQELWALLTLSEIDVNYGEPVLAATLAETLERRLGSLDPLVRLSAAYGLCVLLPRSDRADVDAMLAERVLPAIMETFLQNTYFKDFRPLFDMGRVHVRNITGVELGSSLVDWRKAWLGEEGAPLVRRDLPADQLLDIADELVVQYRRHGLGLSGRDREVLFVGEAGLGKASPAGMSVLYLDSASMRDLVQALLDGGLLERAQRRDLGALGEGFRLLRVRWSTRERTIVAERPEDAAFDALELRLRDLADRQWWQRLHLGKPEDFVGFYELEKQRFGGADAAAAGAAYLHLLQIALPTLPWNERVDALAVVLHQPGLLQQVGGTELTGLLAGLETDTDPEGPVAMLVEIAARNGDPALRGPLFAFLTRRFDDRASHLIKRLLADDAAVATAAADASPQVRRAAMEVVVERRQLDAAILLRGVDDADPRVRRAALLSMGAVGDPAMQARLLAIARGQEQGLQNAALEALGASASPEALRVLVVTLKEATGMPLRSAMLGLAGMGGATATGALREFAEAEAADTDDRVAAVAALGSRPDAFAVEALVQLLNSAQAMVREEAACQLAAAGDTRAVPVLLDVLQQPSHAARALDFLSTLLSVDGGEQGAEFAATWRSATFLTQMDWFRKALEAAGYPGGGDQVQGIPLAALDHVMREGRWFLRYNAVRLLEREFGVSFGTPYRFASAEEVDRIVRRWQGFLVARTAMDR